MLIHTLPGYPKAFFSRKWKREIPEISALVQGTLLELATLHLNETTFTRSLSEYSLTRVHSSLMG